MKSIAFVLFALLFSGSVLADTPAIYSKTVNQEMDAAYKALYETLEDQQFWVVFEPDMGSRMQRMAKKWGDNYNLNNLDGVRSMVFCNINWTHRLANVNPELLALCPLHMTLYSKQGKTTITMLRPSVIAKGAIGEADAAALDKELVQIIEHTFKQ